MHKPDRKNSHKERIFSLAQNKIDFGYQKEHQDRVPKEQKVSLKRVVEAPSVLAANKARESLKNLDGWQLTDDHKMIYREFILHDFIAAIDLIDRIALIAEVEKHHPDLHLTKYRNLRIGLTSHELGGLSEKDLTVARKINDLPPNKAIALNQQLKKNTEPEIKGNSEIKNKPKQKISLTPKKSNKKTKVLINRIDKVVKKV